MCMEHGEKNIILKKGGGECMIFLENIYPCFTLSTTISLLPFQRASLAFLSFEYKLMA